MKKWQLHSSILLLLATLQMPGLGSCFITSQLRLRQQIDLEGPQEATVRLAAAQRRSLQAVAAINSRSYRRLSRPLQAEAGLASRSRRAVVTLGVSAVTLALGVAQRTKPVLAEDSKETYPQPEQVDRPEEAQRVPGRTIVFKGQIEKSPSDRKEYRAMTLSNGLRVLLVSDPDADRSAAAMCVHVGHFSDPPDVPGLAHFCEHMLFLGTKKYPDEASYSQYLSAHGGSSNAYTDTEDTVYYFDVDAPFFEGALDRFSEFFKSPLFTPSATTRELNAIESENAKNLQSDVFRLYQLEKARANPEHPFSKFGTGNRATLYDAPRERGIDVQKVLIDFHAKHYTAPRMTLSIVGVEPLAQLQSQAEKLFTEVPSRTLSRAILEPWRAKAIPPYLPSAFGQRLNVLPVQPLRTLSLTWVFPVQDDMTRRVALREKPEYYVSHLVGHEGTGSLLPLLKRKGLANALSAGYSNQAQDFFMYEIAVDLTSAGEKELDSVQKAAFGYLKLLQDQGIPEYVYEECQLLADLQWRFKEQATAVNVASSVVTNMQEFPEQEYLSGPARLFRPVDKTRVDSLLQQLKPSRAMITVASKFYENKASRREKWYGTRFSERDVRSTLEAYERNLQPSAELHIPSPNPFIPTDLALRASTLPRPGLGQPVSGPTMIRETSSWQIYHKLDRTFGKPKAIAIFQIANPTVASSPRNVALARLFKLAFTDSLAEFAYPAALAGSAYDVDLTIRGMRLTIAGYNDKMAAFAGEVAKRLREYSGPVEPSDFARFKDVATRELQSFRNLQPYMHAGHYASLVIESPKWPVDAISNELAYLSLVDLQHFSGKLLEQGYGTALLQGNLLAEEALTISKTVEGLLDNAVVLPYEQRPRRRISELPATPSSLWGLLLRRPEPNQENLNAATQVLFQIGSRDMRDKLLTELLADLVEQPFYDELRTQQQLGYLVFSGTRIEERIPFLLFIVQSSVADPQLLSTRILDFVDTVQERLEQWSEQDLQAFVAGLINRKLEREKRLEQEALRHWEEIVKGELMFDRPQQEVKVLKGLKKADVADFYARYIRRGGPDRRLMTSMVFSRRQDKGRVAGAGPEDATEEIMDELSTRKKLSIYA